MVVETQLPVEFEALEAFIDWSLERERERTKKREATSFEEVKEFYDAIFPCLEEIVAYLDGFPIDDMPLPAERLFHMTLSLIEVSNLVERYKSRDVIVAVPALKFQST